MRDGVWAKGWFNKAETANRQERGKVGVKLGVPSKEDLSPNFFPFQAPQLHAVTAELRCVGQLSVYSRYICLPDLSMLSSARQSNPLISSCGDVHLTISTPMAPSPAQPDLNHLIPRSTPCRTP
jgi:hypothetical protein